MKKRIALLGMLAAALVFGLLAGCGGEKSYTLQYTYGETYVIEVRMGEAYEIAEIPQNEPYVFDGLYDAESGGVKYVGADGKSVRPFTDGRDVTLYVRFVPRKCTFEFVYAEGELSAEGARTAEYGGEVGALPVLEVDGTRRFDGWYTAENDGEQVADGSGSVAERYKILNGDDYTIDDGYTIKLFAKVSNAPINICFYTQSDGEKTLLGERTVEYGTHVAEAARGIKCDGSDVTGWCTADGREFIGELTEHTELFVGCLGKVIDLDNSDGIIYVRDEPSVLLYGAVDKVYKNVNIAIVGGGLPSALIMLYNAHIEGDSLNGTVCSPMGNTREVVIYSIGKSNGISTSVSGVSAIDVYGDLTVAGNAELVVRGGRGTDADTDGGDGENGGDAIAANSLTVEMDDKGGKLVCYGGDGGHGRDGADATGKSVGHDIPLTGGNGGSGGAGGSGVNVKSFARLYNGEVVFYGGAGGNGGSAGKGQDSSHYDREPAGAGGTGGNGGSGGCGFVCDELIVESALPSAFGGAGGNGGRGGNGGNGENNGAFNLTDYGGRGGNGGAGGNGGMGISAQAIDSAYYTAKGGLGGNGGAGGNGGNGYNGAASGGASGKDGQVGNAASGEAK